VGSPNGDAPAPPDAQALTGRSKKHIPPTAWDSESAREAARRSVEVRQRRKDMTAEDRALEAIRGRMAQLTRELIDAALGQGDFEDLKLDTRVAALKTLMEYGLGKPTAGSKTVESDEEPSGPTAEDLFAQPHVDGAAVSRVAS
jgi:hypothetical protein